MTTETTRAERVWVMLAGACMIVAVTALLWRWQLEVAFVSATIGIVCWFLSLRTRLKNSIVHEVEERTDPGEEDENQS